MNAHDENVQLCLPGNDPNVLEIRIWLEDDSHAFQFDV